jgi:hypothetical protein
MLRDTSLILQEKFVAVFPLALHIIRVNLSNWNQNYIKILIREVVENS